MSDTVSFAELDEQRTELLPARTVLSMFSVQDPGGASPVGGITPGALTWFVLGATGVAHPSSSGADGSANDGNGGASG
ncbi:MAG: hypothetical protein WAN20_04550 [Pseudonocardiaceae bacterium]|jgi:hypothetical protein|nr:hypothetical protein [Pseudonocardiaceae bacterium]